jgi:hypothetical protein
VLEFQIDSCLDDGMIRKLSPPLTLETTELQEVMAKHEHERLHPPPPVPEGGGEEQAGWSVAGDLSVEVASPGKSPGKEGRGGSVVAQAGGEVGLGGEGGAEEKEGSDGAGAGEKGVGKERHIITEENVLLGGLPASMPSSLKSLIPEDTEGTVRSLEWTYSLARKIIESKLMGDAVDRSSLRPFVRLSAYIEQWMARRFGLCHVPKRSGLVAKNMADLSVRSMPARRPWTSCTLSCTPTHNALAHLRTCKLAPTRTPRNLQQATF